ncbi:MAG: NAD(P)/FAD-dependent oxidoreductase [Chloroflexia bacterium]
MEILIVGNGFAGISALETIRAHDREARITLLSAEPCGFYSPASLFAYLEGRVARENLFLRSEEHYVTLGAAALLGKCAVRLDLERRQVELRDGSRLSYDRLLIATGASARALNVPGENHRGVFKLDTLADAEALRAHAGRRVVIVGAGRIGVELASVMAEQGKQVILVEVMPSILPGVFAPEIGQCIHEELNRHGVAIYLEESVSEIVGDPVTTVRTTRREIPCDTVVVATGRRPNVDWLPESLLGDTGGVRVDAFLCAAPGVYAAGDCAETFDIDGRRGLYAVVPTAIATGRIAALNLLGIATPYPGALPANVLLVFGRPYFTIGSSEGEKVLRRVGGRLHLYVYRGGKLVGAQFSGDTSEAAQVASAVRQGLIAEGRPFDAWRRTLVLPVVLPSPPR